jgi:transketolase
MTLTVDRYGASAPGAIVLEQYGFTIDNVIAKTKLLLSSVNP